MDGPDADVTVADRRPDRKVTYGDGDRPWRTEPVCAPMQGGEVGGDYDGRHDGDDDGTDPQEHGAW